MTITIRVVDEWQVLFTKFMDLRMRSKGGQTTMRSAFTHYYILLWENVGLEQGRSS